eukprot:13097192-Alexandrium_andersonii.AAC.1
MSASLVGSEMCIRDRLSIPASAVTVRGPTRLHRTYDERANAHFDHLFSCLLYTSDAADDM